MKLMLLLTLIAVVSAAAAETAGSTIIGEQEAAIGLYLLPWKEEDASDMDRPPRLHDTAPRPAPEADVRAEAERFEMVQQYRRMQMERRR